jgi:hypothetical protein
MFVLVFIALLLLCHAEQRQRGTGSSQLHWLFGILTYALTGSKISLGKRPVRLLELTAAGAAGGDK